MNIEKYKELPKLTEQEVREQTEKLFNFLKLTHPYLGDKVKTFYDPMKLPQEQINADSIAIELRALKRNGEAPFYRNFKLFRFADSEKERLFKFLMELNQKGIPYCLYYSVYGFDNNILAVNKQGKESQQWNNKIAINNAIATQILIIDFDDMDEDEFILEKIKLARLGIETLDVMSGHGFQSIILLDKVSKDKDLLRKFTSILISKGFRVDHKIKDCARIMRPPALYNCKELTKTVESPVVIETFIYNYTEQRYSLDFIFNSLETLETVVEIKDSPKADAQVEPPKNQKRKEEQPMEQEKKKEIIDDFNYDIDKLKKLYPMLSIDQLTRPSLVMLEGFREHYANSMLMFLTLYLKEKGYAKSTIIDAMKVLSQQDKYNYAWNEQVVKNEVNRFYHSNYDWRAIYASDLQAFGYMDYEFENKEIIIINNHVFDVLSNMSSKAFYIYLRLLEDNNYTGKEVYTINEIAEATGVPRRTLVQHLDDLSHKKVKLLGKNRANRKLKEEYTYEFNNKYLTDSNGFTKINISTLKYLLLLVDTKQINPTQLSICLYIKHVCYNGKTNCIISQESLGDALGLDRTSISKSFKNMEKTRLIRASKIDINDFKFKYSYTIHF